jgi:glycosyltransferase involved in cell wall biosynthesis
MRLATQRPLRVLVLTPYGRNGPGGIDRMWDKVRSVMARRPAAGVSVRFLTTRGPYPGKIGTYVVGSLYFVGALLAASLAMVLGRVDVLHVSLASEGSTVRKLRFTALARFFAVPYVIHLRGAEFHRFWSSCAPRTSRAIRTMFEEAATVLVLGAFWRDLIAARAPGARDRTIVLPNATELAIRQPRADQECRIIFLGRLERRKGTPELVDALALLGAVPGWRATLAGDGDIATTRAAVAKAGLAGRVEVPGWLDDDGVKRQLAGADILVLPSHDEGLPNAIVEAFGHGLAVVTTPVGAIPDIVEDAVSGLLVPPGSVDELSAALRRLIADEPLRRKLGENAQRVHRERLELSGHLDKLVNIWRDARADGSRNSMQSGSVRDIAGPEDVQPHPGVQL